MYVLHSTFRNVCMHVGSTYLVGSSGLSHLLDEQVHHTSQVGILGLEELRDTKEDGRGLGAGEGLSPA